MFYDSVNSFSSHGDGDISAAGAKGEQDRPSCSLQPKSDYADFKKWWSRIERNEFSSTAPEGVLVTGLGKHKPFPADHLSIFRST